MYTLSKKRGKGLSLEEKYKLYEEAVQSPEGEVEVLKSIYKKLKFKEARILREDFCGSCALSSAWVKSHQQNVAYCVDLDNVPLHFAKTNHLEALSEKEKKRLHIINGDVLTKKTPLADIVVALNFSYFIFKDRLTMKKYFKSALAHLKKDGVFIIDLFGGVDASKVYEEKTDRGSFIYSWECNYFNPINNHIKFAIHFEQKKGNKEIYKNVFNYDWRLWSMSELRDILTEVGFKSVYSLWEGDDGKGGGNGIFSITEQEENCESWIAYLAAIK